MAAPAAIGEVTYRDTTELDAECALVADAPFAETFMTACSPGIVASAMENRHYATRRSTCGRWPPRCSTEYRAIVERGLLLQIDAPDLALERHTLFGDRPALRVPRRGWSWSSTPSTARSTGSTRPTSGSTSAGATTRVRTPTTCRSTRSSRSSTRRNVGALVISMANARHAHEVRCFERAPAPRPHGAGRRRDRHHQQLRRAPRGRRRPHRAGRRARSATRTGSSPAPTAASTRPPASATWRRAWCGRSSAPCAPGADLASERLL